MRTPGPNPPVRASATTQENAPQRPSTCPSKPYTSDPPTQQPRPLDVLSSTRNHSGHLHHR
eukprot:13496368-Alexandrium_andersonii.AAC.1